MAASPEAHGAAIVRALISGPRKGLMRTLPPATRVRAFYVTRDKTAVVDLTAAVGAQHPGGVQMERLSIYAIVNSLVLNMPGIHDVKILIDGNESLELAGHLDLRFPLRAEMLLIR